MNALFHFLFTLMVLSFDIDVPKEKDVEIYNFYDSYTISIGNDDQNQKYLRFEGYVGQNFSFNMSKFLEQHPDLEYIEVSSIGGLLDEIDIPGRIIASRSLPIVIKDGDVCLSSCAFMALYSPDITINGQLAFHTPFYEIFDSSLTLHEVNIRAIPPSLKRTRMLHEYNWSLSLYELIVRESDRKKYVVFENAGDLNRFRIENKEDFIKTVFSDYKIKTDVEITADK